jgi:hypothetical protein
MRAIIAGLPELARRLSKNGCLLFACEFIHWFLHSVRPGRKIVADAKRACLMQTILLKKGTECLRRLKVVNKADVIEMLEQQLRTVKAEREAAQCDPTLLAARAALKQYQSKRLAQTHADLLAAPNTRDAALFFLDELYGAENASARDVDLERIIPTLKRVLPLHPLQTITQAVMLDALSERLDTAMASALGTGFNAQQYAAAYRSVTARSERERQLALVQSLGESLAELVHIPLLSATLTIMRTPARAAGLGQLQQFLEHGFRTFKRLKNPREFVATIVLRERAMLEKIDAGGH